MKRKILVSGLLVCLLALGLVFVSCGGGSSEGTFTVTDIPAEYNGKYVFIWIDPIDSNDRGISGFVSRDNNGYTLPQISNGKVTIPLWKGGETYSGNGTYVTTTNFDHRVLVKIHENKVISGLNEPNVRYFFFASVTFSKGSATKSYKNRLQ